MALPPPPPQPGQANTAEHKSGGLTIDFGGKPKAPVAPPNQNLQQVHDLNRRVRIVEEGISNIRRKVELDEENTLDHNKKTEKDIQALFDEITDLKRQLRTFKEDMIKIIKELQGTAKKEDVQTLEKYINLWQPIKFVTQDEVASIVDDAVRKALKGVKTATPTTSQAEHVIISKPSAPIVHEVEAEENEILMDKPVTEEIITEDDENSSETKKDDDSLQKETLDDIFK